MGNSGSKFLCILVLKNITHTIPSSNPARDHIPYPHVKEDELEIPTTSLT